MKKVLEILGRLDRAGQETFVMNIFRHIDRKRFDLYFSVNTDYVGAYEAEILSAGGKIFHNPYAVTLKNLRLYLRAFRKFLREEGPFDAVHCHVYSFGGFLLRAAYKEGVPVRIMHSHTAYDGQKNSPWRRIYAAYARRLIDRYATKKVACGKDAYEAFFKEPCPEKGAILPNGIELSRFGGKDTGTGKEIKKELKVSEEQDIFVSVARFCEVKNHEKILSVFKEYLRAFNPRAVLLLVGDGERRKYIEESAKREGLGEKVIFAGIRGDVDKLLAAAEVFLMPSKFEGLPVSLIEAQAAGVRCVVSDRVTDEADMGLGLFYRLPLEASDEVWAETCARANAVSPPAFSKRKRGIERRGYSVENAVKRAEELYDGKF